MKPWQVLQSRWVLKRPWAQIRIEKVRTSTGVVLEDYPLISTRDWACIVCVTEQQELVLVRQYRHGVGHETLEFPAGGCDPKELPLAAAKRELREETGYEAGSWTHLHSIYPETTRHKHKAHLYLATGGRQIHKQDLDPGEEVIVETLPLARAGELRQRLSHGIHLLTLLLAQEALNDGLL